MTYLVLITGVVQGVGFRPFSVRLAQTYGITGSVRNSGSMVRMEIQGKQAALNQFLAELEAHPPQGALILKIDTREIQAGKYQDFTILPSSVEMNELPILPPDLPTCDVCMTECHNPVDRRYRYPLISCASCGPRYSIMQDIPYDRETTVMKSFPLCEACDGEYRADTRRCHAQTISCFDCGPQLLFRSGGCTYTHEEAFSAAVEQLCHGKVLAVKGIGGYQFMCSPYDEGAVRRLRELKGRYAKPFAVMFPSVSRIRWNCSVSRQEESLLASRARPIVLLEKWKDDFRPEVCGNSRLIGAFLPNTALHLMLLETCGPLVVTSGNLSGEPMILQDEAMLQYDSELGGILFHPRQILTPLDDSVARIACGRRQVIRRSRGYVPLPLILPNRLEKTVLAVGGDLKAGFCLAKQDRFYLSQYFGNMESEAVSAVYQRTLDRMERLLRLKPEVIVCDLHPGYHTASLAQRLAEQNGCRLLRIQHHHAHGASVMAEHGLPGCIAVAFDGTGYGTDGTVWGGEFLLCRKAAFERAAFLDPVKMAGGDLVAKDAGLAAMNQLYAAGLSTSGERFQLVSRALEADINTVFSSSMGRLFDAVSYLLGCGEENSYEGECAILLENCAASAVRRSIPPYRMSLPVMERENQLILDRRPLLRSVMRGLASGAAAEAIALGFHDAVTEAVISVCRRLRTKTGEKNVTLSGGVFANQLLFQRCVEQLRKDGFRVYWNEQAPGNDGGICLGQAWLAARILERETGEEACVLQCPEG